ncbi:MAG TPA: hypothetical protein VNZ01_01245 [Solirubrobacteraceae bacterium]|jgi:hypothetical protein|nr:hypothetical protein [Solirubrobacteraceae bacterium]
MAVATAAPTSANTLIETARAELRLALAARTAGNRVSYPARKADRLVRAMNALRNHDLRAAIDLLRGLVLCDRAEPHGRRALALAAAALVVQGAGVPA